MKNIITTGCAVTLLLSAASFAAQDKATAAKQSNEVQKDKKTMRANKR